MSRTNINNKKEAFGRKSVKLNRKYSQFTDQ